ncbi:MAG TPA: ROK family protein [Verrucomicrobiota bacterium]|nr:transcriptional regulator [Verrucomicrobiales bacterium]HRI14701.1 ROK family protein [Verrucomicrobiota bacterium]
MSSFDRFLVAPRLIPPLDPQFRPAALANRAFACEAGVPVTVALEQADGSVFHFPFAVLRETHPDAATANPFFLERLAKFLLWAWGGSKIYVAGPVALADALRRHYSEDPAGKFDSDIIGRRIYDDPITVHSVPTPEELPPARAGTTPLGRHLDGCRIGFDLGGSDRKVAAVQEGRCVFSEETVWDPYFQKDPQYHFDGVMDSLRRAAAHLPRVDAIGGSAAGVYVNNRVKVASLFRGVPPDLFESRVKDLFLELRRAWKGIPFDVVNDGEVTALAGSMALGQNAVLGVAMGTSTAAGFVTPEGNITTWLNELAFVPVDYRPDAPRDEWSGDVGCGAQYFSQQAVGRLLAPAGIEVPANLGLPEKLKHVQALQAQGDPRAAKIYESIGIFLGYALAHWADFYPMRQVLILGRVMTGSGGDLVLANARTVLEREFPDLGKRLTFATPNEQDKRHGQAVAAASLPALARRSS